VSQSTTNLIHKDTGDGTILILPWAYSAITQGTWIWGSSSSYYWAGFWYNSSNAIGDQIDYKVYLSKGQWNVAWGGPETGSNCPITLLLDSVVKTSCEPNSAGGIVVGFKEPLYVPTTGLHTLSFKASPMGITGYYYVYVNFWMLMRVV
jgi:hypothetical protein